MSTLTQHGYLVLADISGYTSYLAKVELDHAHEILTDLLETIVSQFKTVLTISKLEGDAVFAYAPETKITRGEMLLELMESTYVAFKDRVEAARRRTTCECKACRAIPSLDLKFFAHHGDYIVQNVSGIRELVGSDVNLIHRLMKNRVSEATGWKAYALFTEHGLEHLGTRPEGMHEQPEAYEHLGEIKTLSLNLHLRYQELIAARRAFVAPAEALLTLSQDYAAPPPVVWDWINDPRKRALYAQQDSGLEFRPILRPGGRTGVGARTHCMHGKDAAMQETILDWKPFEYLTVEQTYMGVTAQVTCQFTASADRHGTHLDVYMKGRMPTPGFLNRLAFVWMHTQFFPMRKMYEKMARCIAEAAEREPAEAPALGAAAA